MGIVEKDLFLSVLAMMGLAVALSLCSQADAFVAASFTGFVLPAKLAFLVLGPILDFKLVVMWGQSFRPAVVRVLILVPLALVFGLCMTLGILDHGGSLVTTRFIDNPGVADREPVPSGPLGFSSSGSSPAATTGCT